MDTETTETSTNDSDKVLDWIAEHSYSIIGLSLYISTAIMAYRLGFYKGTRLIDGKMFASGAEWTLSAIRESCPEAYKIIADTIV